LGGAVKSYEMRETAQGIRHKNRGILSREKRKKSKNITQIKTPRH